MQKISLVLVTLLLSSPALARYVHLELGAGNYGQEGHTRKALFMTYSANNVGIPSPRTFFEGITENASMAVLPLKPEIQYRLLFLTLDELVKRNPGEQIVFHVNDLVVEWADYASERLREYAGRKGYDVIVETVPGNYFQLGTTNVYDSVHLKNPELMYAASIDGDDTTVTESSCRRMREGLQKLANLGKRGLHFFILNSEDYFPSPERTRYSMRGKFYHNTSEWKGFGYDLPDGLWRAPEKASHVFFIAASTESR